MTRVMMLPGYIKEIAAYSVLLMAVENEYSRYVGEDFS
jgi:hypothetical protein